jgi:hypothetical protein
VRVPLPVLRDDYYRAMRWNEGTGKLARSRARELGIEPLLEGYLE